jgi:hypothetical protein
MSNLLDKLGIKGIKDLSTEELRKLVSDDRQYRALTRAAGRIARVKKDEKQVKTPRPLPTLESTGLAASLIAKLRLTGKSDNELIAMLKEKGVI